MTIVKLLVSLDGVKRRLTIKYFFIINLLLNPAIGFAFINIEYFMVYNKSSVNHMLHPFIFLYFVKWF